MLDPVTLTVLKGRPEQVADEMDATVSRSAFNPIIAEAHDASHGLYEAGTGALLLVDLQNHVLHPRFDRRVHEAAIADPGSTARIEEALASP